MMTGGQRVREARRREAEEATRRGGRKAKKSKAQLDVLALKDAGFASSSDALTCPVDENDQAKADEALARLNDEINGFTKKQVRRSHKAYYRALAAVYRFYVDFESLEPAARRLLLGKVADGKSIGRRSALHIFLDHVIDYSTDKDKRAGQRALSRDAGALAYMYRKQIEAKEFEKKFARGVGGLDLYYRREIKARQKERPPRARTQKSSPTPTVSVEPTLHLTDLVSDAIFDTWSGGVGDALLLVRVCPGTKTIEGRSLIVPDRVNLEAEREKEIVQVLKQAHLLRSRKAYVGAALNRPRAEGM